MNEIENAELNQLTKEAGQKLLGNVPGNDGASLPAEQPKSAQQMRVIEVSEALIPAYQKASLLELTDEEIAKLTAPFPDEVVEIRPHDGLIWIPHIFISQRLTKVFKPGKWALIRRREWFDENEQVMYGEYVLTVRGCYVGESVGGHPYLKNNPKTNYSDALEATAAEALRRICGKRGLDMGSQVWNPEYARQWVAKYAERGRDGKWCKKTVSASLLREPPSGQAQENKTAPAPSQPPKSGDKPLVERISGLSKMLGDKTGWAIGYLRNYTVEGSDASAALLPNENLSALSATQVDWLANHWPNFLIRLNEFIEENAPAGERVPEESQAPESEWFWDIIIPVPYKGMSREHYMRHPDTIRSLWAARHGIDEDSKIKRQRLWGFVNHFEPKGWKGRPPSETDVKFRKALDALAQYMEKKNEKL